MEPQDKNVVNSGSDQNPNSNVEGSGKKKGLPKKVKKTTKTTSGKTKVIKKVTKTKNVESVKNPQIQEQIQDQAEEQLRPVQAQTQFLPSEEGIEKELPVKNLEQQVNKEYQLKDIVNTTKTTMHFLKSLSTTVVKPAIVQKVTTRKPIIAPVDYRTPVNFYEGQPLNEEDLVIQNFFKNTSPLTEATSKDLSNSYLFNGTNYNSNYLSQSVPYPTSQQYNYNLGSSNYDYGSNSYTNYDNNYSNYTNDYNYNNNYTNYTNDYNYNNNDYNNYISQSVQYPSTTPNLAQEETTTTTDTNFVRPQIEKVQVTNSGPQTEKKVVKKKFIKKSGKKKRKIVKNFENVKKMPDLSKEANPVQDNPEVGKRNEEEDDDDGMPRDSVRK